MIPYMSAVYEDAARSNNFIDIFYKCPDVDCLQRRIARYTNEYVLCDIKTHDDIRDNYKPNTDSRKAKFAYAEDE